MTIKDKLARAVGGYLAAYRLRDSDYSAAKLYPDDAAVMALVEPVMSQSEAIAAISDYLEMLANIFEIDTRFPGLPPEDRIRQISLTIKNRSDRVARSFSGYVDAVRDPLMERTTDKIAALVADLLKQIPSEKPVSAAIARPEFKPKGAFRFDPTSLRVCDVTVKQGTGAAFNSAVEMIHHIRDAEAYIEELKTQRPQRAANPGELSYDAVTKSARDVFGAACIDTLNANDLNFTVTVFEWKDRHPKVPAVRPHFTFKKDDLLEILWSIENGDVLAMVGPTGCGKTVGTEQVAARLGRPFFRVPMDGMMRPRALLGGFTQIAASGASSTVWQKGVLEQAMELPSIISVDEFDRADPDLHYTMHQLLEGQGVIILEDGNRTVLPHPNLAILATANTKGRADGLNSYQLQQEMSEATRDRVGTWLDCDYRTVDEDTQFLRAAYPDLESEGVRVIAAIAKAMRASFKAGDLRTTCSHRTLETCAKKAVFLQQALHNPVEARVRAVRSKIVSRGSDEDEVNAISEIASKVIGNAWEQFSGMQTGPAF
jgi:MoxR-like ATPase